MSNKIAHITDLHLDEEFPLSHGVATRNRFEAVLNDISQRGISEVICTGDIGENDSLEYFFKKLSGISLSITLGNHDSLHQVSNYFQKGPSLTSDRLYYSIETNSHKLIFLDSSAGYIDTQQMHWLKEMLASSKTIIVFIHHPIIGLDLKVDEIGALENRGELLDLLTSVRSRVAVFCGHYHMESSITQKNVTQNITPAVSFQIEKLKNEIVVDTNQFGYRIIELEREEVSSSIILLSNAN